MTFELEEKIKALKPEWFEGLHYGLECGDGWFDIIRDLVVKLVELSKETPRAFVGFSIAQIKEKFGTLRFYTAHGDGYDGQVYRRIMALVQGAEHASSRTCELCGKEAKLKTMGYIQTLCRYPHDHSEG